MGFGTKVKRNDFKMAIKTFADWIKNMAQEIEDTVQSQKVKAAKSLSTTGLENFLIF